MSGSQVRGEGHRPGFTHAGLDVGRVLRQTRVRQRLTQAQIARAARVSQPVISRLERGHLGPMSVDAIRRVATVLEVQLPFAPRWRGGELARLLDARHAGLVERVVGMVTSLGWETVVEATFNEYGERGSIDILAWHADSRTLLVIEVKPRIVDLQDLLAGMDRKSRLAGTIARRQRGWSAAAVAVVLVLSCRLDVGGCGRPSSVGVRRRVPGAKHRGQALAAQASRAASRGPVRPGYPLHDSSGRIAPREPTAASVTPRTESAGVVVPCISRMNGAPDRPA